jgi:uridine kinase
VTIATAGQPCDAATMSAAIERCIDRIETRLQAGDHQPNALLVAMSGIDTSGKTRLSKELATALRERGHHVALIGITPWREPPESRFTSDPQADAGQHFYDNAFRFDAFFEQLVDPLRAARAIDLEAEVTHLCAGDPVTRRYNFRDVDVVLVEGIFLLRRDLRERYDLSIWLECTLQTALARALRRKEGLEEDELRHDYRQVYFAAQRVHLSRDEPKQAADLVLDVEADD